MLKSVTSLGRLGTSGDTLIEVTFALAILGFVLLGSTSIAALAFRTGQTARERTTVSDAAQEQMEALRSFRDNHTWQEFRGGNGSTYQGIDNVPTSPCQLDNPAGTKQCFHMVKPAGGVTEWFPGSGGVAASVPSSIIEITTSTGLSTRNCGYDFELHYGFTPLGGGVEATNRIETRLVNLKYNPGLAPPDCPL